MNRLLHIVVLLIISNTGFSQKFAADSSLLLMGTSFQLKAISNNQHQGKQALIAGIKEIQRIETLISSHQPNTETSKINKNAGIKPVKISTELYDLIKRCKKLSQLTNGAFDISFGSIYKLYRFDGSMTAMPLPDSISKYQNLIGYKHIILNEVDHTVYLERKGMKIGFGAIGKGYAANQAKRVMMKHGAVNGFVNASGDILFWGKNEYDKAWHVAIASPFDRKEVLGNLQVENMAVVTSGNYEKNFRIGEQVYSHIIDPKTGYPVTETVSVSIFCPDAEVSDGLATAVSVLGVENGIKLVNHLKDVECLIVDAKGGIHESDNLKINYFNK